MRVPASLNVLHLSAEAQGSGGGASEAAAAGADSGKFRPRRVMRQWDYTANSDRADGRCVLRIEDPEKDLGRMSDALFSANDTNKEKTKTAGAEKWRRYFLKYDCDECSRGCA